MTLEPHVLKTSRKAGWIEVVCGSMFSGKTEELIRRIRRASIARQRTEIFKPAMDNRFSADEVVSHDERAIRSTPVAAASQIILLAMDADVVGIDEAQFFGDDLVDVCRELANIGKRVIVAGLDQDYLGQPFEPLPQIMAIAEYVTKLHAICVVCGNPANHSQRLISGGGRVMLGAQEAYEPRCRDCFDLALSKGELPADSGADSSADSGEDSGAASEADAASRDMASRGDSASTRRIAASDEADTTLRPS
ncbi:MAG: thymidine kinase [Bacteroidetes bacterium]|nr:thymidine kinase [Bacteroidota bacterium]MDA0874926.1 thymidine kinase [Bacteroidota bacterium]